MQWTRTRGRTFASSRKIAIASWADTTPFLSESARFKTANSSRSSAVTLPEAVISLSSSWMLSTFRSRRDTTMLASSTGVPSVRLMMER